MTDTELIDAFVTRADAQAFAAIVRSYTDLVYSAARRQVRDAHLAEEVTQAVFIVLARKASRVKPELLAGWLITTARLTAMQANRDRLRRAKNQREIAMAQSEQSSLPWPQIEALLDEGLSRLKAEDRTAVTLRYLQHKSLEEVAAAMGVSVDAATKRVARAVERMREDFARRGVTVPTAALPGILLAHAKSAAPAHLANAAAANALSPITTSAAHALAKGVIVSSSAKSSAVVAAAVLLLLLIMAGGIYMVTQPASTKPQTVPIKLYSGFNATTTSSALPAQPPGSIRVQAYIDGRSQLRIKGATAQWYHNEYAAPGMHNNLNRPTVLNDKDWHPKFIDAGPFAAIGFLSVSDIYDGIAPPLPAKAVEVKIQKVRARGNVRVLQQPAADNDFTLVIEIDDADAGGPIDYVVDLVF